MTRINSRTRESVTGMPEPSLRAGVACWLVAIGAGVFETVLVVATGTGPAGAALWVGVGVRLAVFAAALVLVAALMRGSRAARWALTVLLGVVGLASLAVPAVTAMADGAGFLDAFRDGGRLPLAFGISRIAHVAAVAAATALMWRAQLPVASGTRP